MPTCDRITIRRAVECEIYQAESRILQMQKELCDIRQRLNDTSPIIYALPAEVMMEIFQELLHSSIDDDAVAYGCSKLPVQLSLGAVCRTWRNITWGFAGLWKRLHFTFNEECGENQLDLVQEWLHRSGSLPLDISLDLNTKEDSPVLDRVLRVLLLDCGRWRTLALDGDALCQLQDEMCEGVYPLTTLTSISFGPTTKAAECSSQWLFDTGPCLRSIAFEHGPNWHAEHFDINWSTISNFTFDGDEGTGFLFLSKLADSISSASLVFCTNESSPDRIIRLSDLQRLSLGDKEDGERIDLDDSVIGYLEVPALQYLSIHALPTFQELSGLTALINRSSCCLVELTLWGLQPDMEALIGLLKVLSSLNKLEFELLDGGTLSDEFIDALNPPETQSSTSDPCLPNISEIIYHGQISANPQKVIDLLKSRLSNSSKGVGSSVKQLKVLNTNAQWLNPYNPNILRVFFEDIWALKSSGTIFTIVWIVLDDSDEDDDDSEDEDDGEETAEE